MKIILLTILLATGTTFAMPNIPDGTYQGKAAWKDSKLNKGYYSVRTEVKNNKFKTRYNYSGKMSEYEFSVDLQEGGFFKVMSGEQQVGSGYCMTVQCHYKASFTGAKIEETLTFWQGNLYRVGSKIVGSHVVAWEEASKIKDVN